MDATAERTRRGTSRPTVLLVEDDADMARHLGHVLSADHDVAYAADGRQGLEMAVELRPDLVITDMMMPELDGAELVAALRERAELAEVPILVLTARAEEELPERMLRQGAQDYVIKPVGKGELKARVENLLQMSGSRRLLQEALESKEESLEVLAGMAARRKADLERAVEEKKVLMRELHHRVKGNLQTITSLLQLQLRTVDDERARRSLEESRGRVAAMGLLHERLYRSGSPDRLELASYARSLMSDVVRAGGVGSDVETELRLEEVDVSVDDAVACGLILHELATNALRHAFPGGRGTLRVELRREAGDGILVVADDGVGMDADEARSAGTLGLELVESLVEQLEGSLDIDTGDGTRVEIVFPLEESSTPPRDDRPSASGQELESR
jgi:two-component sensor histidine kinase